GFGKEVWRAAADVLELDLAGGGSPGQEVDLAVEPFEIRGDLVIGLPQRRAALTEAAYLRAERDVRVQPERVSGALVAEAGGPDLAHLFTAEPHGVGHEAPQRGQSDMVGAASALRGARLEMSHRNGGRRLGRGASPTTAERQRPARTSAGEADALSACLV